MLLEDRPPIDFVAALAELREEGYGSAAIAKALGLAISTVDSWRTGVQPGFENGRSIIRIYHHVFRRNLPEIPIARNTAPK